MVVRCEIVDVVKCSIPVVIIFLFVVIFGTPNGLRVRHRCCGHGFDSRFLLSLCLFQPHPWRLGVVVVFPFELVALEVMLLSVGVSSPKGS